MQVRTLVIDVPGIASDPSAPIARAVNGLKPGRYRITIADARPRSNAQNRRHWDLITAIMQSQGYEGESEKMALHYRFLGEFFGWDRGAIIAKPKRRSSELTPADFSALDDFIFRRASECGVDLTEWLKNE